MIDREMALRLGNYILKLQGVFTEYRIMTADGRREIPWRTQAEKIAQEEPFQQVVAEQQRSLLRAISDEDQGSCLIRALYQEFLKE